ncbi:MAG: LysE family translocator [FCB group bacterium]|nr:LysE family translocator [FCB group bacterium]
MHSLLPLITIMFFAMMSPGPDMILLIKNGICYPRRYALLTVWGIVLGLTFHISVSILGLALIISSNAAVYHFVKVAGAVYLIFIGIQALKEKAEHLNFKEKKGQGISSISAFRDGLFCNLLNVKALLFILSVFTQLIDPDLPLLQKFGFGAVLLLEALVVWSLFVILIQTPVVQRKVQTYRIAFSRFFGVLLVILGLKIFFN